MALYMKKILRNGLNNYVRTGVVQGDEGEIERKILTVEVAEQWIADEDSHDLSEFTMIDDAGAESLANMNPPFTLNGLTEPSDAELNP